MIKVTELSKYFTTYKKDPGLAGSIKALFKRKTKIIKAVEKISFEIKQGELVGFIGPNGAGKTTTLKMLSGLLHPTSGNINVLGFMPFDRKPDFLKQISLVMGQKNQLWWDLPAIDTFILHKELYEVPNNQYNRTLKELIALLDLKEIIYQQVRKMSLGQRMKCELVLALLHSPKILFLDEPTIGLDVVMQKRIRVFLKEYNKKYGATIVLTSHYMDDVKEICQRILMIHHGRLLFDGSITDMIKKYADYKIIIVNFIKPAYRDDLKNIAKVIEFSPLRATLFIKRNQVTRAANEILQNFEIDDLDINEPRLEDITREAFEHP